jgi:hypothetical protein
MTKYYTIYDKTKDKLHEGRFHIYAENNILPINEDELCYVELSSNLVNILVHNDPDHWIYMANVSYDLTTSTWTEGIRDTIHIDPLKAIFDKKNELIAKTQKKLLVPDLSASATTLFRNYLNDLNAIVINNETAENIIWPASPF